MSAVNFELEAQIRDDLGKGASRRLRREEKVLGIVYGGDEVATPIILEQRQVFKALEQESFFSKLLDLNVNGKMQKVVLKDVHRHPYKPIVLHMDFLRVKASDMIHMNIPLHFVGIEECLGVKAGGIVNHLINEIEVRCQAGNIPEYFEVDISKLELDQNILLSQIKTPAGVEILQLSQHHDSAVVSVHMPRASAAEEADNAVAAAETAIATAAEKVGEEKATKKSEEK